DEDRARPGYRGQRGDGARTAPPGDCLRPPTECGRPRGVGMTSDERNGADSPLVSAHPIRVIDARQLGVGAVVEALARPPAAVPPEIHRAVDGILTDVRARGDAALLELTARFDGFTAATPAELVITPDEFETAERRLASDVRAALTYAAERIERYHAVAAPKSWRLTDEHGSVLGQEGRALDRVGSYAPGGRAAYPSTVLMTAVPARVAGVREIVLVTPAGPGGRVEPAILGAARHRLGPTEAIALRDAGE